ncbi:MAG: diguanylate cyclase [Jaaginema sp. PMC 1079.18]|nr:diguanylate cyclase [Jaaginema sp. PMC 1080.18]MEC4851309.1 diguanylate cyclase [Jaaginema sp. PMC 1079.18]MEC4866318.1 diguanylate cyclase [Jaaginema sp. PMC 1078.18]
MIAHPFFPFPDRQYVQIDREFVLYEISPEASRFADCPEYLQIGWDARLAFPELVGLEESLATLKQDKRSHLTLEGLSRFTVEESPFFFDLWIARHAEKSHLYWIGLEDSTQRTLNKQVILHHANTAEILIKQLSAARQYTDTIINAMADALIVTDREGKIKTINPAVLQLFELPTQELIAQPITLILTENQLDSGIDPNVSQEILYTTPSGKQRYLAFNRSQFQIEGSSGRDFIYLIRDITVGKQAELKLQQYNKNLNRLIEFGKVLNQCKTRWQIEKAIALFLPDFFQNWHGYLELKQQSDSSESKMIVAWGDLENLEFPFSDQPCQTGRECDRCVSLPGTMMHCLALPDGDTRLGKLHLRVDPGFLPPDSEQKLAIALAEQIALAVANVNLQETLENQSSHDALTHLYNRRHLAQTLPQALNKARSANQSLCVVMVDVDHFKKFNDTWGHGAGDRVLEVVAQFLADNIRQHDIAYRYGGEEFLLVLQQIEPNIALSRIQNLCTALRQLTIPYENHNLSITVSCGIASFPDCGQSDRELLQKADAALYQAKAQGRDRVVLAPCVETP